jgi:hypothetical protein
VGSVLDGPGGGSGGLIKLDGGGARPEKFTRHNGKGADDSPPLQCPATILKPEPRAGRRGSSAHFRRTVMPRGDKTRYTDKQKRQAEHIESSYKKKGVSEETAGKRAWATVNKQDGGGKKSGSGRKHG